MGRSLVALVAGGLVAVCMVVLVGGVVRVLQPPAVRSRGLYPGPVASGTEAREELRGRAASADEVFLCDREAIHADPERFRALITRRSARWVPAVVKVWGTVWQPRQRCHSGGHAYPTLPYLQDPGTVVSEGRLAWQGGSICLFRVVYPEGEFAFRQGGSSPFGIWYASRIYAVSQNDVIKQTTGDIAERECWFYERLGRRHQLLRRFRDDELGSWSSCVLERFDGAPLTDALAARKSPEQVVALVLSMLAQLEELDRLGIEHRGDNRAAGGGDKAHSAAAPWVVLPDGRALLVDFGFAAHPDMPFQEIDWDDLGRWTKGDGERRFAPLPMLARTLQRTMAPRRIQGPLKVWIETVEDEGEHITFERARELLRSV